VRRYRAGKDKTIAAGVALRELRAVLLAFADLSRVSP
jgi:hypothetical protein